MILGLDLAFDDDYKPSEVKTILQSRKSVNKVDIVSK